MTVTEAVTASGITPSADYKGIENTDELCAGHLHRGQQEGCR